MNQRALHVVIVEIIGVVSLGRSKTYHFPRKYVRALTGFGRHRNAWDERRGMAPGRPDNHQS